MQEQIILAVDDNPLNLDLLVDLLNDYTVLACTDAQHALRLLQKYEVDLILLDIMMPDMDGIELATLLKKETKTKEIPILFLSADNSEETIEKGFDVGAVDYVSKPFRPRELLVRVNTHLKMSRMYKEIHRLAYYDSLSGAKNRRCFFEEAQLYLEKSTDNQLYAVMIDIDKFKSINDVYGHGIGDQVIRSLCDIVHAKIDKNMLFARLGGEEFALLINSESKDQLLAFIESLRKEIDATQLNIDGKQIRFQVSCGVSVFDEKTSNLDLLMHQADVALYEAKNTGRNRVKFRS